jgi:AcrR family transcriptional regulator
MEEGAVRGGQMAVTRKKTLQRREDIVNATRKLIIKHGSEHITIKRMAKEVGFTEAAIYRHFKSKSEILSVLVDNVRENLLKDLTASTISGNTPLQHVEMVLRSHFTAVERRRGVSFQVINEIVSLGDKTLNKKVLNTIQDYLSTLKGLLNKAAESGEIRKDVDNEAAAMALFGSIQGLVNVWVLNNYSFDPQERFSQIWEFMRAGLTTK